MIRGALQCAKHTLTREAQDYFATGTTARGGKPKANPVKGPAPDKLVTDSYGKLLVTAIGQNLQAKVDTTVVNQSFWTNKIATVNYDEATTGPKPSGGRGPGAAGKMPTTTTTLSGEELPAPKPPLGATGPITPKPPPRHVLAVPGQLYPNLRGAKDKVAPCFEVVVHATKDARC